MAAKHDQILPGVRIRSNLKAQLDIYQLQGKETLWWEEAKGVHLLEERIVSWEEFQKQFKNEYLSKQYYNDRAKEFHELRLGQLSMDEFVAKFMSLLQYIPYIKEEKDKVQHFLNCLPTMYKRWIEFDNPKTMEESIRKV